MPYLFVLFFLVLSSSAKAQDQDAINYQAIIRQPDGSVISSSVVNIRLSICADLNCTSINYQENHTLMTSPLGVVNLRIGRGAAQLGDYADINWSEPKYLHTAAELFPGQGYVDFGTSELVSVPYARFADRVRDNGSLLIENDSLVHRITSGASTSLPITAFQSALDCRDDFLLYRQRDFIHHLLSNDRSQAPLYINKVDGQLVSPQSVVSPVEFPFLNIRLDTNRLGIQIFTDYPVDTIAQFSYEACTQAGVCSSATATIVLDNQTEETTEDEILDADDWLDLLSQANDGDTIDLQGRTLLVSGRPIPMSVGIQLTNGIIKRAATPVSSLAQASLANTNLIVVNDPHLFRERERILLLDGPGHQDNSSGQGLVIREIRGDTIESFNPFINPMDSGATVIHQFPLLQIMLDNDEQLYLSDLVFDGNKQENPYTYDWRYNHSFNVTNQVTVDNCTFKNMPAENIFMCGGQITNSRSYELNGSFVHGSCPNGNADTSWVKDNYSFNTCLVPGSLNGHNEGWFTYSARVRYFQVLDNVAINGGEACFGSQGLEDYDNTFSGNYFDNFLRRKFYTHPTHPNEDDLSDNVFINMQNE